MEAASQRMAGCQGALSAEPVCTGAPEHLLLPSLCAHLGRGAKLMKVGCVWLG